MHALGVWGVTMLPSLYRRLRCALLRIRLKQLNLAVLNAAVDPGADADQVAALMALAASARAQLRAMDA